MSVLGAAVHGRPLRAMAEIAGLVGAEITGVIAGAMGAGIVALLPGPTAWAGVVLLQALIAGAGPLGFDMAQSWVPEEERARVAPAGPRAAVHAAGVAGALLFVGGIVGIAAAVPTTFTVVPALLAVLGLPYLTAVARRLAVGRLTGSRAVLPVSLAVIVGAAPAVLFLLMVLVGRLVGED